MGEGRATPGGTRSGRGELPEEALQRVAHPALAAFHEPVRAWFAASFPAPTRAQELAWPLIARGDSTLLQAPTGSGKTLAAFLAAIDAVMFSPAPRPAERCRILYVSPLKALAVDVERNLRAPLVGTARWSERLGVPHRVPEVALRTGDTPARERAAFARRPADILVTTPESLYLLLTSQARELLRAVRWVIVDEIHALVGTKRGAHLAVSLERLEELVPQPLQRIGLSATVRPAAEAAAFLGGYETPRGGEPAPRPVSHADATGTKVLDLIVEVALEDMARPGEADPVSSGPAAVPDRRTSIWPAIHPLVLELVRRHRTTLIFVNSRRLAERLAGALNELAGESLVRAHHGSIAREQRQVIEDDLKAGRLPALVATSSLELGIDMGAVDLVILVEAPPTVASAMQRVGRAGHQVGAPSRGIILPKYRGDLLACAALAQHMLSGAIEEQRYPRNPLDVLAQQIVAMVALEDWTVDRLASVLGRAAPFARLPRGMLEGVLDMLAGRYPSDDFAELRPRVTWDRLTGRLTARHGARRLAVSNSGTIPDRGLYGVFLAAGNGAEAGGAPRRVGELDEEMVFETRAGDTITLGATSWRVEEITHDRVLVSPAAGQVGRMPFWKGEGLGRSRVLGEAVGRLCRTLRDLVRRGGRSEAMQFLQETHRLTPRGARNLLEYLADQERAAGVVPDDRTLVVERYLDDLGDWRVCILSPFGGRVHAPWALAIRARLREERGIEVETIWADDGIVVRFPESEEPPAGEWLLLDPDELDGLVVRQLGQSAHFAARFREAAGRALLLPRRYPGHRTPLWQQRRKAGDLLQAAAEYGSFPLILEAYRECLQDDFDLPALRELLVQIRQRSVRVVTIDSRSPSPFAAALLFGYVARFMYEGDAPLAELRAQALTVDPAHLRELLGEVELYELLDHDALEDLERELQCLVERRSIRTADGLHDLLLRLGDLAGTEIAARTDPHHAAGGAPRAWIEKLEQERRIVPVVVAGEHRYVAVEDMARYRDALGAPPPPGLPASLLEPVRDPLGDLVLRYARTHGPFSADDPAARWGLGVATIEPVLRAAADTGRLVEGVFRPGGAAREWCEAGVLRTLRQRSLARLRKQVEPAPPATLQRLALEWQGVRRPRRGCEGLLEAIEQLQGAPLLATDLESRILPARVEDYEPWMLDELTSSGMVTWLGLEPHNEGGGRLALYLADQFAELRPAPSLPPDGLVHQALRERLAERGASFFAHLVAGPATPPPGSTARICGVAEAMQALWDLVWAGEVTNDTLQPLRALLRPAVRRNPRGGATGLRARTMLPQEAGGRWSLVAATHPGGPSAAPAVRCLAVTRQLLQRYGIITRDAVRAEGVPGGYAAVYPVLRQLEDAGRVRRGYFVEGRGAAQFGIPGAVDRLRDLREPEAEPAATVLAASDPANLYGAALPWPTTGTNGDEGGERASHKRPARSAGAVVVLLDGVAVAWLGRGERSLVTFPGAAELRSEAVVRRCVAEALAREVRPGLRRALLIREVDGVSVTASPFAAALEEAGFVFGPQGFMRRL